ncbi:cadherin-like beta sandwich domain-containing protein [Cohnella ginsengisoli]|uniref:Cadherin-like beta sandwich domain-containing protein n=1 Tax=Cohnella ginsengisoli TaxID=425004 RepID=A0A9X4QQ24_9BACL|nr:cadherin-like beta sandwich domain-containing protein [Cohnella ginsengisoli]MDG0794493.1 cadherin-like beta sandwich domain-containing protein [Cohnella ginsengisoli]
MLKGTAWVDVKSIKSQEDDFKLETPTAIMGVRGTAFFARVNPATGGTNTAVMSGVVRFTSENMEQTGSGSGESLGSTGASGSKTIDLYPTQQISLEPTSGPDLRELTTLVDIEEIVKNASPEVIEAILRSKAKIDEENRQTIEKFKQTGLPPELPQSLDKFTQNAEELLGVIAKQAIKQKKIDEQQVKKIEEQEKTSFNLDKDQLSQLDQKEKAKLEKARQLAEEAAKKKATEEAAKLKELADKINAAALKAIEAAKLAQDEANRLAAEAAKRKAEEELLKKLNEQQKQQYQQDKANNQGSTTAPNTNTNNLPSNANLGSLSISGAALSPSFNAAVTAYRASVTSDKTSVVVGASVQESGASFTINGQVPGGGQRTVSLAYGDNEITVLVTAQNGSTQAYKVTVTRQLLNNVSVVFAGQSGIDIDFNSTNAPAPLSIPSGSSNLTLVVPVTGPEIDIAVNGQNVEPIPMFTAARTLLPDQIAWRYVIPLAQASNEIEIKATIDGVVKSYKLFANRTMSSDAAVQSVSATSEDGTMAYEVRATGGNSWTVKVPADVTTIKLKINAINPDAKILMGANEFASGTVIPYTIINTTVPFQVRAADGTVPEVFNSISISRLPSSDASLSGLVLSHGTLSPAFASATTNYTANVGNAVESITVKPTASNGNATVAVNDTTVQSGNQSELIPLRVGTNQITVEVMAQNGSRQKYTIIITRAGDTPPHLTSWSAHTSEGDVLTWIYSVQWGDGIPLDTYAATVPNRDTDQVELTLNFDESMYDYAVIYPSQGEEIEFFNGQPKSLPLQDGEISRYELYMYKNGQSDENIRDVLKIRKGVSDFSSAMTALDVEDQDENTYSVLPWSADKEYVLYADADAESLSFDSYDYRNGLTIKDANDDPFENAAFDIPLDPGDTLLNVHIADEFSEEVFKLRVVKTPLSPSLKLSRLTVEGE